MAVNEEWKTGYIIGEFEGQNKTLLDAKFEYVPKIHQEGKEYIAYDFDYDYEKQLNITILV